MDGLIGALKAITEDKETPRVLFEGKTYFELDWMPPVDVAMAKRLGYLEETKSFYGKRFFIPSKLLYKNFREEVRARCEYPQQFEEFWQSYHKARRVGKKAALNEWLKLNIEDIEILPGAAAKYAAHIEANSNPKYMKHPERFIKSGEFRDWLEMEDNSQDLLKFRGFFQSKYYEKFQFGYAFSEKETIAVQEDLKAHGLKRIAELSWIYFNDYEPSVRQEAKDGNYNYFTFSYLLKGALGRTKKTVPPKCEFCGKRISHSDSCPEKHKAMEAKREEAREVEAARNMDYDLTGNMPWKNK